MPEKMYFRITVFQGSKADPIPTHVHVFTSRRPSIVSKFDQKTFYVSRYSL